MAALLQYISSCMMPVPHITAVNSIHACRYSTASALPYAICSTHRSNSTKPLVKAGLQVKSKCSTCPFCKQLVQPAYANCMLVVYSTYTFGTIVGTLQYVLSICLYSHSAGVTLCTVLAGCVASKIILWSTSSHGCTGYRRHDRLPSLADW